MSAEVAYGVLGVCVLIYIISFLIAWKIKDRSKYLSNLPGPTPIFPFGNTLRFIFSGSGVFLSFLQSKVGVYGETILAHDGPFSWAIITIDYDFTEVVLTSPIFNDKASQYEYFHGWLGQGLLTSSGYKWRSHRKAITPSFHFSILQDFIGVFDTVGEKLVNKLRNEVGKDSIEISEIISMYALDVICEATMGVKINALDQENIKYIRAIKTMCNIVTERTFSFLKPSVYPFTWNYYREQKALKVIHEHVDDVINKRIDEQKMQETYELVGQKDESGVKKRLAFLDLLLKCNIDGSPLSRKDLRDEVNTFMFEGHDTTSSAICFCLYLLAENPDVQQKVLNEQHDIFGPNLKNVSPKYKDLNDMKYLDLVIKETLRLYPSVPFFGRRLAKDFEFKGTLYPAGIAVMILPYIYHRNPKYFPDPEKFIPERFQAYNGKLPFIYTPFSAGSRNCIGQKFAMLEMLSTISKIVRNFELIPAKPKHKLDVVAETILISKTGIKISIQNRAD